MDFGDLSSSIFRNFHTLSPTNPRSSWLGFDQAFSMYSDDRIRNSSRVLRETWYNLFYESTKYQMTQVYIISSQLPWQGLMWFLQRSIQTTRRSHAKLRREWGNPLFEYMLWWLLVLLNISIELFDICQIRKTNYNLLLLVPTLGDKRGFAGYIEDTQWRLK